MHADVLIVFNLCAVCHAHPNRYQVGAFGGRARGNRGAAERAGDGAAGAAGAAARRPEEAARAGGGGGDADDDLDDELWENLRAAEEEAAAEARRRAGPAEAADAVDAAQGGAGAGCLRNVERFVVGLFASLVPSWQPAQLRPRRQCACSMLRLRLGGA